MLRFGYTSSEALHEGRKEAGIHLEISDVLLVAQAQALWLNQVPIMLRSPPGIFDDLEPSAFTGFRADVRNICVVLPALGLDSTMLVDVRGSKFRTHMVIGKSDVDYDLLMDKVELLVSTRSSASLLDELSRKPLTGLVGQAAGDLCAVGNIAQVRLSILLPRTGPDATQDSSIDVDRMEAAFCADSLASLQVIGTDIASSWTAGRETRPSPPVTDIEHSGLAVSLEEQAFDGGPSSMSDVEFIQDNLPSNKYYLAASEEIHKPERREGIRDPAPLPAEIHGRRLENGIRILHNGRIRLDPGHWSSVQRNHAADVAIRARIRVRVKRFNLRLHNGYDWSSTRQTIQAERKTIRRKLQKLKQMLASGHTPDPSAANARILLFDSILIGLPEEVVSDDSDDLLAAIEDQMEQLGTDGSSSMHAPSQRPRHRERWTLNRSRRPAMEIILGDLSVDHREFDGRIEHSGRTVFTCSKLDLIDHLETSTWKTFLTRLSTPGEIRETDSQAIRFSLDRFASEDRTRTQEDYRIKVEVQPLRMNVDQDALDFLSRFFAFKLSASPPPVPRNHKEPYLQRVEVLPIRIKLDYKPKRVSFKALKSGKAMEMMNFFHFEGSQMVLRKVVLSGVSLRKASF